MNIKIIHLNKQPQILDKNVVVTIQVILMVNGEQINCFRVKDTWEFWIENETGTKPCDYPVTKKRRNTTIHKRSHIIHT